MEGHEVTPEYCERLSNALSDGRVVLPEAPPKLLMTLDLLSGPVGVPADQVPQEFQSLRAELEEQFRAEGEVRRSFA